MIIVTRLTGQPFAINPDLIERVECTPDTILVLMDGTRYIVAETMPQVVTMVKQYRASIVAQALEPPAVHHVDAPAGARPDASAPVVQLPTSTRADVQPPTRKGE